MLEQATTPQRQIQFYVISVDDMKLLHDFFQGVNRVSSSVLATMNEIQKSPSETLPKDLRDAFMEVTRLSELNRREIHARLAHGPVTVTSNATAEV